jgi:hypothetical protein
MTLTPEQRQNLLEAYVTNVVDSLDWDDLVTFAYETILERLEEISDESLIEDVKEWYPNLLEEIV